MTTKIALNNIQDSAVTAITSVAAVPKITSISVTDNSYTVLDDTAVGTSGGYIKIVGTGFTSGSQVLVGTVAATSVSFVSSTELRAQLPATTAGTYVVYVVATDGAVAIRVNGITFSATPTWSTGSSLGTSGAVISIQLAATSDTTITYSLASGSTLPTGLTLSSSGLLSGTVTGVTVDTVYNFTVTATDAELQDSPRSFSITITVKDPNFSYVPLLVETGSVSVAATTVADGALTPNTVTRVNNPSTGWVSPYQTDGYWSNYFNGSSQLSIPNNTAFEIGAGNFSYEAFVYATVATNTYAQGIISYGIAGSTGSSTCTMDISSTGFLQFPYATGASATLTDPASFPLNQWVHCVACRSGSTISLFVNGVRKATTTTSATVGTGGVMVIGGQWYVNESARQLQRGYISNARVLKGASAYDATLSTLTVPTAPLTAITNTVLLTCQSNRFKDNSSNNFTVTPSGTPSVQSGYYPFAAPTASPGAGLFNGTNQYLSSPASVSGPFDITSGNFTLEAWIYPTSFNSLQTTIIGTRGAGASNWELRTNPGATPANQIQFYFTGVGSVASSVAPTLNTWSHLAITRSTNSFTMYLNGVSVGTSTFGNGTPTTTSLLIGLETTGGTDAFPGYIGNLRIVKGTVVYTGAFTPPSGPLTQTGGTYPSLTNVVTGFSAANTTLLLALSDSNYTSASSGGTNNSFIDDSNYAFPITRNGTPTQGSITPYWPNGQWSNYFNGSSGYLSIADNAAFNFGTGNATVEFWFNSPSQNANNYPGIVSSVEYNVAGSASIRFDNLGYKGKVFMYVNGGGNPVIVSASTVAYGTWNHVAIVRESTTFKLYLNGTLDATAIISGSLGWYFSASGLRVGRGYDVDTTTAYYLGYVSNLRLVKGVAVYTGAFTPPASPLQKTQAGNGGTIQAITGTQTSLLTCQSNQFIDNGTANSGQPFTITVNGTPTVQAFQPFSPTASYTTALYGGSGYLNNNSAYLTFPLLTLGSTFTVEGWFYATTIIAGSNVIISNFAQDTGTKWIGYNSSNLVFSYAGTNRSFAATINANTWYHFAFVITSSTVTCYLNGAQIGTTQAAPTSLTLDTISGYTAAGITGYLSNFRIVNGTAVYTGAFTPPTLAPLTTAGSTSAASYPSTTNVNTSFAAANTSLLLNFTNAAIYDATVQNNVVTVGDAQASTTQFKWSPTSMRFDGTGDLLYAPSNAVFDLATGDFTIEFWFNTNTLTPSGAGTAGYAFIVGKTNWNGSAGAGWSIFQLNQTIGFFYAGAALNSISTGNVITSTGTWYYVAVVRSGTATNNTKIYINGVQQAQGTPTVTVSTSGICVGGINATYGWDNGYYTNGYIQDFRITKGVARYTANFTPPTLAFQIR
jgi:hypothetical protein